MYRSAVAQCSFNIGSMCRARAQLGHLILDHAAVLDSACCDPNLPSCPCEGCAAIKYNCCITPAVSNLCRELTASQSYSRILSS